MVPAGGMTVPNLKELLPLGPLALHRRLLAGHPIDPSRLDGTEYHGIALGNPRFVEWLTWKTFKKVFHREAATGILRGWNVAVVQRGVGGPFEDRFRRGRRVTYWHYEVHPAARYRTARPYPHAQVIDYGRGERGALNPQRLVRDPLVALRAGSVDLLLGFSYLDLGFRLPTPTFFALVRGGPLTYEIPRPGGQEPLTQAAP